MFANGCCRIEYCFCSQQQWINTTNEESTPVKSVKRHTSAGVLMVTSYERSTSLSYRKRCCKSILSCQVNVLFVPQGLHSITVCTSSGLVFAMHVYLRCTSTLAYTLQTLLAGGVVAECSYKVDINATTVAALPYSHSYTMAPSFLRRAYFARSL
jgi:hypothetical protein